VQYLKDAEQAGDQELASFFRDIQEEDRQRAERAKMLLRQRLSGVAT
jgi:rubrerythrin